MGLLENHIEVSRTARYATLGELNSNTKDIWILLHGHRRLARNFILDFKELAEAGSCLIAPEGLMRLYLKGDYGDIGASWMTKEDRENDIKDYVNYLDKLFFEVIKPSAEKYNLKINALGFSQGVATLSRWLTLGKAKVDKAVFWCGSLGTDIDHTNSSLKNTEVHLVFADNDEYFKMDFYKTQEEFLTKNNINFKTHIFKGKHEVNAELLKQTGILN